MQRSRFTCELKVDAARLVTEWGCLDGPGSSGSVIHRAEAGSAVEAKDRIAVGTLGVSLISAWATIGARDEAQELADCEFATEEILEILASVCTEIFGDRE